MGNTDDAGRGVREALGRELLAARKGRDTDRVGVQRSLLAAIDNAEAVAAPQAYDYSEPGLGRTEAARASLDVDTVRALFVAEREERVLAAAEYRSLGQDEHAAELDVQCALISDYIERLAELSQTDPTA